VNQSAVWNLSIISLCAALVAERLLLLAVNWSAIREHPRWALALAMVHHPLVAGIGVFAGFAAAALYVRRKKLPVLATADVLAAPLAMGLAFEQAGALLAGAGYGTETSVPWAVIYSSPAAALWSGTPLGVAVHPVQAYAALAFLALAVVLLAWLPARRRDGDAAGICLLGMGTTIYLTELWRDPEGRGAILKGAINGPQIAAVGMVLVGALIFWERKGSKSASQQVGESASGAASDDVLSHPFHDETAKWMGHGTSTAGVAEPNNDNGAGRE
jgi:phosphatidylglycerol---prolipoprotein diacylglyceryl transferase